MYSFPQNFVGIAALSVALRLMWASRVNVISSFISVLLFAGISLYYYSFKGIFLLLYFNIIFDNSKD